MALRSSADRRILIACSAACTVGFATIFVQPLLFAQILSVTGMTETSAGFVLTLEMLAVGLSSALCAKLCRGKSFRVIALVGTALALSGNGLSYVSTGYGALLTTRVLCGIGEGAALFVAGAACAHLPDPERAYAQINTVTIVIGTVLIYATPLVGRVIPPPTIFPTLLLCFAVLIPALMLMPRTERFAPHRELTPLAPPKRVSVGLALIWTAFFALVTVNSAVFSFCAIIGEKAGLDADGVSAAIAVATMASLVGCALAGVVDTRFGRLTPMVAGVVVATVALICLSNARNPLTFWLSASTQMICAYFLMPYFQGYAAQEDPTGRGVAAINAAIPLSYAVGPFLAGVVAQEFGFRELGWVALFVNIFVLGLIVGPVAI
jgi:predicted MFS family arabinose efflux permease